MFHKFLKKFFENFRKFSGVRGALPPGPPMTPPEGLLTPPLGVRACPCMGGAGSNRRFKKNLDEKIELKAYKCS